MKKIFILAIFLLTILNTRLFAFEGISFKVKEEGWIVKDDLEKTTFQLITSSKSGYEKVPGSGNKAPMIEVIVRGNRGKYPKYDYATAKELGEYYSKTVPTMFGQLNKHFIEKPQLKKSSVSTFGKYEAFRFEISFYPHIIIVYAFVSEKYLYLISMIHYDGDNFTETVAYKNFIDSFEMKDPLPSWFAKNIKSWFKGSFSSMRPSDIGGLKPVLVIAFILMIIIVRKLFNSNWG